MLSEKDTCNDWVRWMLHVKLQPQLTKSEYLIVSFCGIVFKVLKVLKSEAKAEIIA